LTAPRPERSTLEALRDNMANLKRKYLNGRITFWEYRKQANALQDAIKGQQLEVA
jgi:hypothetical protein